MNNLINIDLAGLSKPLKKLVVVVSNGIGTAYAPTGTVRQAKADAKSKIIRAKAEAEVLSIHDRAQNRLMYREVIRQENIERIASQAANELPDKVSDEELDKDWIIQFFDHAQDVCDDDLQILWSRILAGEVSSPGSYSKRTLQFLKSLDKWEAEKFSQLCSIALITDNDWHFIFHSDATNEIILKELGEGSWIEHFRSIGLFSSSERSLYPSYLNGKIIKYYDVQYEIEGPEKPDRTGGFHDIELPCFWTVFSNIGQQLANIASTKPVDGYIDQLSKSLQLKELDIKFIKVDGNIDS